MDRRKAIRQLHRLNIYGKDMRLAAEDWEKEWQTLIAIILSARTRDEVTIEVCKKLFREYKTIDRLAKADDRDVGAIIRAVNFYRNKTRNIIFCAKMLASQYGGKVPHDIDRLIELPGVGRKTANVFLSEYNHDSIGVDTHVFYISRKLGWVKSDRPEKIEKELERLFPKKYWRNINGYLVRFGKTYTSRRQKDSILEKINNI